MLTAGKGAAGRAFIPRGYCTLGARGRAGVRLPSWREKTSQQHWALAVTMSTPSESDAKPDTPLYDVTAKQETTDENEANIGEQSGGQPSGQSGQQPGDKPDDKTDKEDKEAEPVDLEQLRANFQEKAKTYLIEQSRHVVIPSFSKWFDMNSIHSIEKKLFPDFFPRKSLDEAPVSVYKTAETYQNMRDFMINTYRINPIEYLTVTAVRRNLAGDVASIIRVHRFLEKWGLINYQIDPRTKPSLVGPQYTGHFQVTLDTPKGLVPFVPEGLATRNDGGATLAPQNGHLDGAPTPQDTPKNEDIAIPINMEITRNIFDDAKGSNSAPSVTYTCNETSNDISNVRYHNLKSKAAAGGSLGPQVISKECYEQGLFPLNFSASDFVKLNKQSLQSEWSLQEILLLLEGVEMYASAEKNPQSLYVNNNDQWDKISEHVASKKKDECLVKFLQLPIEDKYLQKLIKQEKKEVAQDGVNKEEIVQEVVKKLIETAQGKALVQQNSVQNLEASVIDQKNLINQIIELTLEKFEIKSNYLSHLEADLVKTENLLNLQRKQVLVERWLNFEKIHRFKEHNQHPELAALLDDLLTPISINEINLNVNKINLNDAAASSAQKIQEEEDAGLPVSVAEPKSYKFWSA